MVSTARGLSGQRAPNPVATGFRQENAPAQTRSHNMADVTVLTWETQNTYDRAKLYSVPVSACYSFLTLMEFNPSTDSVFSFKLNLTRKVKFLHEVSIPVIQIAQYNDYKPDMKIKKEEFCVEF